MKTPNTTETIETTRPADIVEGRTPGPWYFRPEEPSIEAEHPNETGFFCTIADCGKSRTLAPAQMQANARLIASAPDLLQALRDCVDLLAVYQRDASKFIPKQTAAAMKTAQAAIAKATQTP